MLMMGAVMKKLMIVKGTGTIGQGARVITMELILV
jgi:hypothetical protein